LLACCDYGARQQTGGGARLLRLWNGWDALPVYRALYLFFNCFFLFLLGFFAVIGDRVQGQGFFSIQICDIKNFGDCFFSQN